MEPVTATSPKTLAPPTTSSAAVPSLERAEALARYNEALIAPLVAELAETRVRMVAQADRIADLARENGALAERMAGLERVRDAAMAHAAELEDSRADHQALRSELEQARTALDKLRAADAARRRTMARLLILGLVALVAVAVALVAGALASGMVVAPGWVR